MTQGVNGMSRALLKAVGIIGSRKKLAKQIGCTIHVLKKWINDNIHVPLQYALEIERVTEGQVTWQEVSPHLRHYATHWSFSFSKQSSTLALFTKIQLSLSCIIPVDTIPTPVGEIHALYEDIKAHGLQRAIGIDAENHVIFGKKRLQIYQMLGKKTIDCWRISLVECIKHPNEPNDLHKNFIFSERVDIALALEKLIGTRQRQPIHHALEQQIIHIQGRTSQCIASLLGFGHYKTYWEAKKIYLNGSRVLIAALDRKQLSIYKAFALISLSEVEQAAAIAAWLEKATVSHKQPHPSSSASAQLTRLAYREELSV